LRVALVSSSSVLPEITNNAGRRPYFVGHKFHVKKLAVNQEIFISDLSLALDIRHITDKDTLISVKMLKARTTIDFTTEKITSMRSLNKAIDALIH